MIDYSVFEKLDFRVGTIINAEEFPEAKKPAYKLQIDFGPLGVLNSSAQITKKYQIKDLRLFFENDVRFLKQFTSA